MVFWRKRDQKQHMNELSRYRWMGMLMESCGRGVARVFQAEREGHVKV